MVLNESNIIIIITIWIWILHDLTFAEHSNIIRIVIPECLRILKFYICGTFSDAFKVISYKCVKNFSMKTCSDTHLAAKNLYNVYSIYVELFHMLFFFKKSSYSLFTENMCVLPLLPDVSVQYKCIQHSATDILTFNTCEVYVLCDVRMCAHVKRIPTEKIKTTTLQHSQTLNNVKFYGLQLHGH